MLWEGDNGSTLTLQLNAKEFCTSSLFIMCHFASFLLTSLRGRGRNWALILAFKEIVDALSSNRPTKIRKTLLTPLRRLASKCGSEDAGRIKGKANQAKAVRHHLHLEVPVCQRSLAIGRPRHGGGPPAGQHDDSCLEEMRGTVWTPSSPPTPHLCMRLRIVYLLKRDYQREQKGDRQYLALI